MTQNPLDKIPSAEEFAARARRQTRKFNILAFIVALLCGFGFIAFNLNSPLLPIVLLVSIAAVILIWNQPRFTLYLLLISTCVFEMFMGHYSDGFTDRVPIFWNVNTIFQIYAGKNVKAVPLNLVEVLLLITGLFSFLRAVAMRQVSIKGGPLFLPIAGYIVFVVIAWVNGTLTGGDFKDSLQEVRSQFYFIAAYLMAVNLIRDRSHVNHLLWISAICIGLKGISYTYRRYVLLAGLPLPDQGVGSHEEAFLFDAFAILLASLCMCGVHKKLQIFMWILLPIVITGNLATNRRAATAALVVVVPVLLLAAYRALPNRRRLISIAGVVMSIGWCIYYPLFRNSDNMFAQPARAMKSQFEPSERDASSNAYRDAENACLMATIRVAPLLGYGYGKRMLHAVPMADISDEYEWWDLLPHNQVLWVWMRVGTIGFVVFWYMVGSIVIYFCGVMRSENANDETKAIGLFALLLTSMLMMFGLLDLQLSNSRDMLFVGFWIGTATAISLPGVSGFTASGSIPSASDK